MNNRLITTSTSLLSAEAPAGLVAALAVFVTLTVLLTAFIVLMFANKSFRAFFMREKDTDELKTSKPRAKKATPRPAGNKATPAHAKTKHQKPATTDGTEVYLPKVETVPLDTPVNPASGAEKAKHGDQSHGGATKRHK